MSAMFPCIGIIKEITKHKYADSMEYYVASKNEKDVNYMEI